MKYYYLISGKLYWANSEMPKLTMYSPFYDSEIMILKDSLQPCEITERDLNRIINRFKTFDYSNPISVTDLVNDENGVITFKHPKQVDEASEAVELIKYLDECIEACDANCSVFKGKEMKTSYLCSNAMKTAYSNVKTFIQTTRNI